MKWQLEDTAEMAEFRQGFRQWLRGKLAPGWLEAIDAGDDDRFAEIAKGFDFMGWMRVIGESGYGAPLWPKEYGGLSGEPWMQQVVREELARYRLPLFGVNLLGVGLAGPTIIEHGTEEQKKEHLPKILTGEEIWCQLFSEPGSGSDLASLSTRALRDGDEWVVNGQKVWTTIAQIAHFGMLLARTDPNVPKHDGLTYFILDMKTPGVEVRPLKQMTGGSEFNEVYFTDVRIPDSRRVGAVGDGWRCARTTLMNERVALSGISLDVASITGGTRRDPWRSFLEGLSNRSDPTARQAIAQFYIEQECKEITAFRANSARLRGQQPGPEGGVNKVFNAEFNQRRSNFAINAAGMAGVAWLPGDKAAENRAHAFLRARANTIEGGTSEVLRNQMAERILGLPRDVEVDRGIPWKDIRRN
jgi:alkylation response protein AidB-like acyl-CoA dehydrogenase